MQLVNDETLFLVHLTKGHQSFSHHLSVICCPLTFDTLIIFCKTAQAD